jgi:hypothetical protein
MTRSYFVALAFIRDDGDIVPGDAFECPNAMDAALQAQVLSHAAGNIGAVAYSRTANDVGVFSEAVIIKKFGDAPSDLKNQAPVSRGPILYGARRTSGRAAISIYIATTTIDVKLPVVAPHDRQRAPSVRWCAGRGTMTLPSSGGTMRLRLAR